MAVAKYHLGEVMTRSILALGLASLSIVAAAAPPITEPVEVTVSNEMVPVSVVPTWTPPSDVYSCLGSTRTTEQFSTSECLVAEDVVIQHLFLQLVAATSTSDIGPCQALVTMRQSGSLGESLGLLDVRPGGTASLTMPLPHIYFSAAEEQDLVVRMNNTSGVNCQVTWTITGVKVP